MRIGGDLEGRPSDGGALLRPPSRVFPSKPSRGDSGLQSHPMARDARGEPFDPDEDLPDPSTRTRVNSAIAGKINTIRPATIEMTPTTIARARTQPCSRTVCTFGTTAADVCMRRDFPSPILKRGPRTRVVARFGFPTGPSFSSPFGLRCDHRSGPGSARPKEMTDGEAREPCRQSNRHHLQPTFPVEPEVVRAS